MGVWRVQIRFVGKQAFLEALSNVIIYPDGTPRTKHVTANVDLAIDEEAGKAHAQSYVTVFSANGHVSAVSDILRPLFR